MGINDRGNQSGRRSKEDDTIMNIADRALE